MPYVGRVHAYLVLASCLKYVFNEAVTGSTCERVIVCYGIFAAVVDRRRKCNVGFVVFQPAGYGSAVAFHFAAHYCHITPVVDGLMPIVLKGLLDGHVFGVDHQTACVAVEAVDYMGRTPLMAFVEIIVKHAFNVERAVAGSHRQNADRLVYDYEVAVFIYNVDIAAVGFIVSLL